MDDLTEQLRALEPARDRKRIFYAILPYVLFAGTLYTTLFAGALMKFHEFSDVLKNPALLVEGAPFAIPLLAILLSHEMGHYLTSRYYGVDSTLPHFIPFPNYIGTFGALIKMKSPMRDRKSLMDIGAAGPLAGFVLSVAVMAYGLTRFEAVSMSDFPPESFWHPRIAFGPNLLVYMMMKMADVRMEPGFLYMSPFFDAGWIGLFMTSLNLLPVGQLDGGHIAYSMLGGKLARKVSLATVAFLIGMSTASLLYAVFASKMFFWPSYGLFALIIVIIGLRHPPPMVIESQLDPTRKIIGALALIIFLLTFTPLPLNEF